MKRISIINVIIYLYNINGLEALCGGPIWVLQSINQSEAEQAIDFLSIISY